MNIPQYTEQKIEEAGNEFDFGYWSTSERIRFSKFLTTAIDGAARLAIDTIEQAERSQIAGLSENMKIDSLVTRTADRFLGVSLQDEPKETKL